MQDQEYIAEHEEKTDEVDSDDLSTAESEVVDTDHADDESIDERDPELVEEEASVESATDDDDEVTIEYVDDNGERIELGVKDIEDLIELRKRRREIEQREQQVYQYNALLQAIGNDHFLNRIITYRLSGYDPSTIVQFLYNYFMENNLFDNKQNEAPNETSKLERELNELKSQMELNQRYNDNTQLLLRSYYETISNEPITDQKLAADVAQKVIEIIADMVGEKPDHVIYSSRITPSLAKAAWREVVHYFPQLAKKEQSQASSKKSDVKKIHIKKKEQQRTMFRQIPANAGIKEPVKQVAKSDVLSYSPENARMQLRKLLQG